MKTSLSTLKAHPHIWRAREKSQDETKFSLGFKHLDKALNGGIPSSGLIRISSLMGIGELTLFKQVLCNQHTHKMVVFINPPGVLQVPWLENLGLNTQQVWIIKTKTEQEALWAAEQSLKSTACYCVILWNHSITPKEARRLQVAATHNDALCLLYTRASGANHQKSLPITVDLSLQPKPHKLSVSIRKQRHGWPVDNIVIYNNWTPNNHAIKWAMEHNKLTGQVLHSVS